MKSVIAVSLLALVGAASAAPSVELAKRDSPNGCPSAPSAQGVFDAINAWNSDVVTVNNFLNMALGLTPIGILTTIESVLNAAEDEPTRLQTLACVTGVSPGTRAQAAADDLFAGFDNNVIVPLGNILSSPGDAANVQTNLDTINIFRCCNVLPDLDVLWSFTAAATGISSFVPLTAPRPNQCANIICG